MYVACHYVVVIILVCMFFFALCYAFSYSFFFIYCQQIIYNFSSFSLSPVVNTLKREVTDFCLTQIFRKNCCFIYFLKLKQFLHYYICLYVCVHICKGGYIVNTLKQKVTQTFPQTHLQKHLFEHIKFRSITTLFITNYVCIYVFI